MRSIWYAHVCFHVVFMTPFPINMITHMNVDTWQESHGQVLAGMWNLLFWGPIWNTCIYSDTHLITATFFARLWVLPSPVSMNIYSSSGHELYISLSIYAKGIFILKLEDLMCSSAKLLSLENREKSRRSIHIPSITMFIHKYVMKPSSCCFEVFSF